ncbi:MAG: DNA polymerase III subunit delta' [Rhodospirillaceae bacterium]|nr:DNA polymerase III subunit delta' [Rhodospirillaceae bacterium]
MTPSTEAAAVSPRVNTELIGQAAAEAAFARAWRSGKIHHAWLIAGQRGIGKATLAYRFARFVLAGGAGDAGLSLPLDHPVVRQVASGAHPGLMVIERTYDEDKKEQRGELRVEEARAIGHFLHMTSVAGAWRVVIIDSADDLNPNAANAILKILEEPPARSLLLLISHAPGRLLPTIRSRCRRLSLPPLAAEDFATVIRRHVGDIGESDLANLVALVDGSPGRALELWSAGGLDLHREMMGLLQTLPRLDAVALHGMAGRLARPGAADSRRLLYDLLTAWLAHLIRRMAERRPAAPGAAMASDDVTDRLAAASARLDPWLETWDKIGALVRRADSHNLDPRQVLLNVFLAVEAAARA